MLRNAIMRTGPLIVAGCTLVCGFVAPLANADIYMWTDASGGLNVSNMEPPDGARVTKVIRTKAPASGTSVDAARDAAQAAQVQALNERIAKLERDAQVASMGPPPDVVYPPVASTIRFGSYPPSPPPAPYVMDAPAYGDYGPYGDSGPYGTYGCNPGWPGCWPGWAWPPFYPVGIAVIGGTNGHHHHGFHGGNRGPGIHPPVAGPHRTMAAMR